MLANWWDYLKISDIPDDWEDAEDLEIPTNRQFRTRTYDYKLLTKYVEGSETKQKYTAFTSYFKFKKFIRSQKKMKEYLGGSLWR